MKKMSFMVLCFMLSCGMYYDSLSGANQIWEWLSSFTPFAAVEPLQVQFLKALRAGNFEQASNILAEVNKTFTAAEKKSFMLTQDGQGKSALHYAVEKGNRAQVERILNTAKTFLQEDKALLNKFIKLKDAEGKTALHTAVAQNNAEKSGVILDSVRESSYRPFYNDIGYDAEKMDSDPIDEPDAQGKTPLHTAVEQEPRMVNFLLVHGAQPRLTDNNDTTELDHAIQKFKDNRLDTNLNTMTSLLNWSSPLHNNNSKDLAEIDASLPEIPQDSTKTKTLQDFSIDAFHKQWDIRNDLSHKPPREIQKIMENRKPFTTVSDFSYKPVVFFGKGY